MKKYRNIVIPILSVISTIISIIAICRVCPNTSDLGLDYQGIIVGILALLVTVLIGWQIYTAINVKEELKEIFALRKEINKQETDIYIRSEKNLIEFHMAILLMYMAKNNKNCNDVYQIILSGLSAMIHQSRIGLYKDCENVIKSILANRGLISMLRLSKQSKESLLNMMTEIGGVHNIENYTELICALYSISLEET